MSFYINVISLDLITCGNYCGQPDFWLNCTEETAVITITNLTYQVLDIDSESQTLKVARTDYIGGICPNFLHNTSLNSASFNYSSGIRNITLYYHCPALSTAIAIPQGFSSQFTCPSNNSDRNGPYVRGDSINFYVTRRLSSFGNSIRSFLETCKDNVTVPAIESAVPPVEISPTEDNLIRALEQGFGLQWTAKESTCATCKLSGGICGYNHTTSSFACYCSDQAQPFSCGTTNQQESGDKSNISVKLGIGLGAAVAVAAIFSIRTWRSSAVAAIFNIKKITNSFADKLGQGGFGSVYRGKLKDGRCVAVKVLNKSIGEGEEFINEVASISRTSHVNIVTLLGFCYERTKRALIYEYMPNGSLDIFIYDLGNQLERKMLSDIAIGIARGLEYLHQGCNTRIVHFDIKPQNVLLDDDFCPKISDFGLAKLCKRKESIVSMLSARGTVGYIAPEVFMRSLGQ
ncbi:LEAF RUST 10 DISEASE-RESISTANCE LOCUS RECEPTOR-LIKE PROTEIN KINASE-like 2.7 [Jatropha curcas]|uniref:LEAF RUST 10 DISEASE-RESISTANCE LOCUS RECEPTOR-LIKE PROTEIN KINASE-like 2.7 n=1 Tax=Jatropha curcas TaxID=180498 RepID=UPI001894249D|nr:LEAF RUST 10 DISEASE-RESISTANCE LOCUS RECEPTOR-LIKE PROTEIN KINASE-like 2.7 [Jatropha curcas]